jgi:hypothetical protein
MTFTVQGLNRVIYTNKTASSLDVTLGAAGAVVFDVNTPGAAVTRHALPQQGGTISMTVAPNATIDANTNTQVGVQVELLQVR